MECAIGEKMDAEAPGSSSADYMLPTLYTSCIEDYLHGMEADLPIFSMFPSPIEATSASPWHGTGSEQTDQSFSSHPAQDIAFQEVCAPLNAAHLPTGTGWPDRSPVPSVSWTGYAATRDEPYPNWLQDERSLGANGYVWLGGSVLNPIVASQDVLSARSDGEGSERTSVRSVAGHIVNTISTDLLFRIEGKEGPGNKAKVANKKVVSRQKKGRVSKLRAEGKMTRKMTPFPKGIGPPLRVAATKC
ncbi:hypothetical protein PMIN01_13410 [Paraphaeosphaeria minitans]|uniref:Uncharacterized protein n=1 Tax=Paraphaeosphaeria minitans TaxID=565426 RepID=A0A9P6G3U2_9PLEO|nr:hypothetical protein PMIN01_13410 [Paraphaeosphaeria minitans]